MDNDCACGDCVRLHGVADTSGRAPTYPSAFPIPIESTTLRRPSLDSRRRSNSKSESKSSGAAHQEPGAPA